MDFIDKAGKEKNVDSHGNVLYIKSIHDSFLSVGEECSEEKLIIPFNVVYSSWLLSAWKIYQVIITTVTDLIQVLIDCQIRLQ